MAISIKSKIVFSNKIIDTSKSIIKTLKTLKKDTLYLRSGVYRENILNKIPNGKTISAYKNEKAIIRPDSGHFVFQFQGDKKGFGTKTTLLNLVIDGVNISNVGVKYTKGSSYNKIIGCEVINTDFSGILTNDNSNYNQFIDNYLHDFGNDKWDHGIYIASSHNRVIKNRIENIYGCGVQVYWSSSKKVDSNYVAYNRIKNVGLSGHASGILLSRGSGHMAKSNVIRNAPFGISIRYGAKNAILEDNDVRVNDIGLLLDNDISYTKKGTILGQNRVEVQTLKPKIK